MMRPEDAREHLDKRPFAPFRICMSDGMAYDITHPDLCIVSRTTLFVGVPHPTKLRVAMGVHHCALVHIVRVEPSNGHEV